MVELLYRKGHARIVAAMDALLGHPLVAPDHRERGTESWLDLVLPFEIIELRINFLINFGINGFGNK
jgi:hypothetical protein